MRKLSKREKVLLTLLTVLLISCSFIVLFFLPQLQHITEQMKTLNSVKEERAAAEEKIARYGMQQSEIDKLTQEGKEAIQWIFQPADNEVVDQYVQNLIAQSGLKVRSMNLSGFSVLPLDTVSYPSEIEENYVLKDAVSSILGKSSSSSSNSKIYKDVSLMKNSVQLTMEGSFLAYETFLDIVKTQNTSIYVTETNASLNENTWQFSVVLSVYASESLESK